MKWLENCLYCNSFVYHLNDGRLKCSSCNKKISKKKINKIIYLIESFVNNESGYKISKKSKYSYVSVQKYFKTFRILCASICEMEYEVCRVLNCEYEEYYYLEKSKKSKREAIFDAHNFLTFDYEKHIYTLLMPSLKQYKSQFLQDSVEGVFIDEFNKFKRDTKIIKVSKHYNNIVKFWEYFEEFIVLYKGVEYDSFIYFLKECEFKYNHSKEEAIELLISTYFKGNL